MQVIFLSPTVSTLSTRLVFLENTYTARVDAKANRVADVADMYLYHIWAPAGKRLICFCSRDRLVSTEVARSDLAHHHSAGYARSQKPELRHKESEAGTKAPYALQT